MKLEINLPTHLNEIPLSRYQEFLQVQENSNDEEFIAQKMIEIFCGINLKDVAKIKLVELNALIEHFSKLFNTKHTLQHNFKIDKYEFGFITELEEITFGEYVDIENYLVGWENMHKAMAVLYRPIIKKHGITYEIAPYEPNKDFQELMKYAPLGVALSARVFFYNLEKELLMATLHYLENLMKKQSKNIPISAKEGSLINNGDGIQVYMDSLKATSQSLMKLQNIDLLNVLPISPTKNKKTKSKQTNLINN